MQRRREFASLASYRRAGSFSPSADRATQVVTAQRARDGVRAEADYGSRSMLDILAAERDRVVAAYSLLAAMGDLTAEKLGLGVTPYDPLAHYEDVKDKWAGYR